MAKVSKVNVSITGDSRGLTKATDEAAANMRRLRAENEATRKKLGQFKTETNQVAESLSKFGLAPKGLQALGALSGLSAMGMGGLRLAALGGVAAGLGAVASAYADLGDEARAAADAQQKVQAGQQTWRQLGFTEAGGTALAGQAEANKAIGFTRAFSQTAALAQEADKGQRSNLQNIMEYGPGAIGAALSGFVSGRILEGPDFAKAIGVEEQRRLNQSLHEEFRWTMGIVDYSMDFLSLFLDRSAI